MQMNIYLHYSIAISTLSRHLSRQYHVRFDIIDSRILANVHRYLEAWNISPHPAEIFELYDGNFICTGALWKRTNVLFFLNLLDYGHPPWKKGSLSHSTWRALGQFKLLPSKIPARAYPAVTFRHAFIVFLYMDLMWSTAGHGCRTAARKSSIVTPLTRARPPPVILTLPPVHAGRSFCPSSSPPMICSTYAAVKSLVTLAFLSPIWR